MTKAVNHIHAYEFDGGCGAQICYDCGDHQGLARCYCGWALDGGNGYAQLEEMGEQIEADY
jgi:hypothetical protein